MNESKHNRQDVFSKYYQDILAIKAVHSKFEFAAEYLPIFICIHICSIQHFHTTFLSRRDARLIFNSLNHTSYQTLIESINNIKQRSIKHALLKVCDQELLHLIFGANLSVIEEFSSLQVKNMQSLYTKRSFRTQILTLYTHFVKNFITDYK